MLETGSQTITVDQFLESVRRHQLIGEKQLDRALAKISLPLQLDEVTQSLSRASLLTPFQIQRLLARKADGYFVGSYLILEPIGRTSGGQVFKARHRTMNRHVAIKILSPQLAQSQQLLDTFHHQTRIAAKLLHPNIITTYDAARLGNRCYAVLEYYDGLTLQSLVDQNGPLPLEQVLTIAEQLRQALAYAHSQGVAHGGLKPSQMLVGRASLANDSAMELKVLNFGLSCLSRLVETSATIQLDNAMSAADYTAPEALLKCNAPTAAADLFSFGCVLYFLLTGSPPKPRSAGLHQQVGFVPLQRLRPDLPHVICQEVERLLAKNPAQRPSPMKTWEWLKTTPAPVASHPSDAIDWSLTTQSSSEHSGSYLSGFATPVSEANETSVSPSVDGPPSPRTIIEKRRSSAQESFWPIAAVAGGVIVFSGLLVMLVVRSMIR